MIHTLIELLTKLDLHDMVLLGFGVVFGALIIYIIVKHPPNSNDMEQ